LKSSEFQVPYNITQKKNKVSPENKNNKKTQQLSFNTKITSIRSFDFIGIHLVYGKVSFRVWYI